MKKTFLKEEFEKSLSKDVKDAVLSCAKIAEEKDFKIYLIGGVVRDLILGNQVFDIDIIVEGDAVEFAYLLTSQLGCDILQLQSDLKTAKVVFPTGIEIDFASTRCEEYLGSGILPVAKDIKCSLKEDVLRRDFSVNAMALVLNESERFLLVDYLDGKKALKNKELIVLHSKSFIDDPSRIVRGLKFAVRFGFKLDSNTKKLQNEYLKSYINSNMPLERIRSEIQQLFSLNMAEAYDEFVSQNIWKLICKKLEQKIKGERIKKVIDSYYKNNEKIWLIYLACLLINEDNMLFKRLNLSNKEVRIISDAKSLIFTKDSLNKNNDDFKIYKFFNGKVKEAILIYYIYTRDERAIKFLKELSKVKIIITGDDLIKLGFEPSSKFTEVFDAILNEKLKSKAKTKEDELAVAKNFL